MALTLGFEPGPHWWEASTLTTVPSLAPLNKGKVQLGNPKSGLGRLREWSFMRAFHYKV